MKLLLKGACWTGILILVGVAGHFTYERWIKEEPLPVGLIQANGRIEGDHVAVSSKFSGRVKALLAREGDTVQTGQLLVQLDDPQVQARVKQAKHALDALQAQVKAAQTSLGLLKKDVPLNIEIAEAGVAHARAMVAEAEATEQQKKRESIRYAGMFSLHAASEQSSERANLALALASKELASARTALTKAKKGLAQARLGWDKIRAKKDALKALEAQRDQAGASLEEAESVLRDFSIQAPTKGTITTRMVDAGEVVSAGAPLLDLVNLDRLYLKVYAAEYEIGKLRLGLPARIHTDAFPDQPFEAVARYISSRAEFTPKEVQTPDERVKLVYAVKLYLTENPDHRLTPGMPADAVIRWKKDTPWVKPKW
jgi:HlyD family secretion protein